MKLKTSVAEHKGVWLIHPATEQSLAMVLPEDSPDLDLLDSILQKIDFDDDFVTDLSNKFKSANLLIGYLYGASENEIFMNAQRTVAFSGSSLAKKMTMQSIVDNHLQEYPKVSIKHPDDLAAIFNPTSTYLGWENRNFAKSLPEQILPWAKTNPEVYAQCYRIFLALRKIDESYAMGESDITVSEMEDFPDAQKFAAGCFIPLDVETVEALQDFSLERLRNYNLDFRRISPRANQVLMDEMINPIKNDAFGTFSTIAYAVSQNRVKGMELEPPLDAIKMLVNEIINHPLLLQKTVDYIVNSEKPWSGYRLNQLYSTLVAAPWRYNKRQDDDNSLWAKTVTNFLEKVSFQEYLDLIMKIQRIPEEEQAGCYPMTWFKISKKYDELKDLPIEWWFPLTR